MTASPEPTPHRQSERPDVRPQAATVAKRAARARATLRGVRYELIRRLVLDHDRIDVLGTQVLGYDLRPFHLDLLAFQGGRAQADGIAPRAVTRSVRRADP